MLGLLFVGTGETPVLLFIRQWLQVRLTAIGFALGIWGRR